MAAKLESGTKSGGIIGDISEHARGCGCAACRDDKSDDAVIDGVEGLGVVEGDDRDNVGFTIGESPATASTILVGGARTGVIDFNGDNDWYGVSFQAGQTYTISLNGLSLSDPLLRVYSSSGTPLAFNDDFGSSLNSQITYTATSTGTFYISAEAYSANTGSYTLSVSSGGGNPAPPTSGTWEDSPNFSSQALDSISWDTRFDHTNITVFFGGRGFSADGITSEGFNGYETAQIRAAFATIAAVTNLTFTYVNNAANADMQLLLDLNEFDSLGYFNPPGTSGGGVGVFGGDSWDRTSGGDLSMGGFGFVTVVHEILHGLGMAHPHDRGGDSSVMPGVTNDFDDFGNFNLNQGIYTTMTYNSGYFTGTNGSAPAGTTGVNHGFEAGPMALDIGVLQGLYGANTNHNNGNTNYYLDSNNGLGTYWSAIWDTGGIDAIRHSGTGAANIDLRAATLEMEDGGGGYVSAVNGIRGGFTIANGVVIERAYGGGQADRIRGNDADNQLIGYGGFDSIFGGVGNDTILGGDGSDSLYGENGNDAILGGDGFDQLYGGLGNDTLNGGERPDVLYGGSGNDRLVGGTNVGITVDRLFGGNGDDTLLGGGGYDRLSGDSGDDFLSGGNQADNIFGGFGNDTMRGDQGLDRLFGGANNDIGFGGTGRDGMFGEQGNDTLYGGADDDRFFGGVGNDQLFGEAGNDIMGGGAGFDRINGGAGNDSIVGNFNADTFVFENGHGNDTIADFDEFNSGERLDFSGLSTLNSLAQVLAAGTQVGGDVVINTGGGNSIRLRGVLESNLDSSDFIF